MEQQFAYYYSKVLPSPQIKFTHLMNNDEGTTKVSECSCFRKANAISCDSCQHIFLGRKRIKCTQHPLTIHLMDVTVCPKCHSEL